MRWRDTRSNFTNLLCIFEHRGDNCLGGCLQPPGFGLILIKNAIYKKSLNFLNFFSYSTLTYVGKYLNHWNSHAGIQDDHEIWNVFDIFNLKFNNVLLLTYSHALNSFSISDINLYYLPFIFAFYNICYLQFNFGSW